MEEKASARRRVLDHPWIGLQARDSGCRKNTKELDSAMIRATSDISLVATPSKHSSVYCSVGCHGGVGNANAELSYDWT